MVRSIKRRYIAFKLSSKRLASKKAIENALLRNMPNVDGKPRAYIRAIEYNPVTGLGILRCGHIHVDSLLQSIREVNSESGDLRVESLGVSGSIKTLRRKFLTSASHSAPTPATRSSSQEPA